MKEDESQLSGESGKLAPALGGGRIQQLDFLRGVAILLVLVYHSAFPVSDAGLLVPITQGIARYGWAGVDLFFVLSGFLIGGLLFKEIQRTGTLDVRRFLIRRGLKIWPAYFVLLAYTWVKFVYHGASQSEALARLWPNLLHVQNYFGTRLEHTWSLAVEEHFYVGLPIVLLILLRVGRGRPIYLAAIPWMAITIMAVWIAIRCQPSDSFGGHRFKSHERGIDALFLGVMLAYWDCFGQRLRSVGTRWSGWLMVAGVILQVPLFLPRVWIITAMEPAWATLTAVGWGCVLVSVLYAPRGRGIVGAAMSSGTAAMMARIGVFSYGIYLWHMSLLPLQHWVGIRLRGGMPSTLWYLCVECFQVLAAIAIGVITTRVIEWPMLKLRDRLFPARTRMSSSSAADGQAERAVRPLVNVAVSPVSMG